MKIVVLESLGVPEETFEECVEKYIPADVEIIAYNERPKDSAELIKRAKDAEVLVIANMPLRKDILEECPNLKMISVAFTGLDHVDLDYCDERGIVVTNCAGYSTEAVAELVFAMALSLYRRLKDCDVATRNRKTSNGLLGRELYGKTFGIVGAGAIGRRVSDLAQAFGCNVVAYSRTPKNWPGVTFVSLEQLLVESDIVSIHVPATQETIGLIDSSRLKLMKPSAILINAARGPVVNSAHLTDALNTGVIAGAGLDVFDSEPPLDPENGLLHAKNTIVSPHVGFLTEEALLARCDMCIEHVGDWLHSTASKLV